MSDPIRWRARLCYAKAGRTRFISHLDFVRLFERAARRAGLPLAMSEGFSPAPKIAYGWPLPVGTTGLGEYVDVELTRRVSPENLAADLNRSLPEGLEIREARYISPHGPSLMAEFDTGSYMVHLPARGRSAGDWRAAAARLLARPSLELVRDRGPVGAGAEDPAARGGAAPATGAGEAAGTVATAAVRAARDSGKPEKRKVVDVRPLIRRLDVREVGPDGRVPVFMELALGDRGAGRPEEVAGLLVRELEGSAGGAAEQRGTGAGIVPRPEGMTAVRLGLRRESGPRG